MDPQIYLDKFSNTLNELRNDIQELKLDNQDSILSQTNASISEQLHLLYKSCNQAADDFSGQNVVIFTSVNSFLKGINLYELWKNELNDETEKSVWKYLNTLYLYSYLYVNKNLLTDVIAKYKSTTLEDAEKLQGKDKIIYTNISQLYEDKRMKKKIEKLEKQNKEGNTDFLNKTVDKTAIGQLAKEIASEIDPNEFKDDLMNQDPNALISSLMSGDMDKNSGLSKLISKIGSKINQRMESGQLTEESLLTEAQDIIQDNDILKNIPNLANLNQSVNKKKSSSKIDRKKLEEKKKLVKNKSKVQSN